MTSLSTGASRRVPATPRLSNRRAMSPDAGRPDLRWRRVRSPLGRALLWLFFAAAAPLLVWQHRLRERDALRRLPDYILRDIGLDPEDVHEESEKPFWRA